MATVELIYDNDCPNVDDAKAQLRRAFAEVGLVDPTHSDCPGKIVCPIDGELVCRDECPLGEASTKTSAVPVCCRGKK